MEFGVPLEVVNDGEVTALAGSLSLGDNAILGIAMGSSQAAGFLDPKGASPRGSTNSPSRRWTSTRAPGDEWSGDLGWGVHYFSQQAVNRSCRSRGSPSGGRSASEG